MRGAASAGDAPGAVDRPRDARRAPGLDEDEQGRMVFDGVWAHIAGARGPVAPATQRPSSTSRYTVSVFSATFSHE